MPEEHDKSFFYIQLTTIIACVLSSILAFISVILPEMGINIIDVTSRQKGYVILAVIYSATFFFAGKIDERNYKQHLKCKSCSIRCDS